ncbi:MAG: TetR/AcrR family transcriptional regulator [Treponema sp.]|jgi:AcrR family transcriptional regulator|nr:TetR/AcrR family transcriptional regulator [Treponema sp.]
MTKTDIVRAAFRVWGRQFYQSTSLAQLARDLRVTKSALYRYFDSKEALENAMYETYYDEYAAFLKPYYDEALSSDGSNSALLNLVRVIVAYYAHNIDAFLFSLIQVYGKRSAVNETNQFHKRGFDIPKLLAMLTRDQGYPTQIHVVMASTMYWLAQFHRSRACLDTKLDDEQVNKLVIYIEESVMKGLGYKQAVVAQLDYERLETLARQSAKLIPPVSGDGAVSDTGERLLKAVSSVVAELGPWEASMDMVAQRAGMSKSGLYAHFRNKQDMLTQLFLTEFDRIFARAEAAMCLVDAVEEKLYMAIISIADYLRSYPEILIAMDWIRVRQLKLNFSELPRLFRIFAEFHFDEDRFFHVIKETSNDERRDHIPQWIVFLIVNTLMYRPVNMDFVDVPDESVRLLYRALTCGMGGFK